MNRTGCDSSGSTCVQRAPGGTTGPDNPEPAQCVRALLPRAVSTRNNLASLLLKQGNAPAAIQQYELILELDPRYIKGYNNLGIAYLMAGDAAWALRAYEKAMRLVPEDPEAHYNMALLYQRQGMEEEAGAEMALYWALAGEKGQKE